MRNGKAFACMTVAGLLLAASPAAAEYWCTQRAAQNERPASLQTYSAQRETVTVIDGEGQKPRVVASWISNLGVLMRKGGDSRSGLSRLFSVIYGGTSEDPWHVTKFTINFPIDLKLPLKPLHVFLTLESGEHAERLLIDENGSSLQRVDGILFTSSQPAAEQVVARFDIDEEDFLAALGKAKKLAVDFKYADGETLSHEIYDVAWPAEIMRGQLNAALEMDKDFTKNCRYIDPDQRIQQ